MEKISILVTCANSKIMPPIASLLREYSNAKVSIIGVDSSDRLTGLAIKYFDEFYQVPNGEEENYFYTIKKITEEHEVHLILVGSDEEMMALKKNENNLPEYTTVFGSSYDAVKLCNDKLELMKFISSNTDLPLANFTNPTSFLDLEDKLVNKLRFPNTKIVIKPRNGRGSKGFRILNNKRSRYLNFITNDEININFDDLKQIFLDNESLLQDYLFMEYLEGEKYSADLLLNKGEIVNCVIRSNGRAPKVNPPTQLADLIYDQNVFEYVESIAKSLNLDQFAQIEVGKDDYGTVKLIEINTRLDATLPITNGVGQNYYHAMIDYVLNNRVFPSSYYRKSYYMNEKVRFIRYFSYEFIKY